MDGVSWLIVLSFLAGAVVGAFLMFLAACLWVSEAQDVSAWRRTLRR